MYINGMEPYSSMDMMGIKSGDLLVAYDDTIATIYRAGGIKLRLKDIQCVQVEKGRYLTELEVMDWGKTKYGHVAHMTWDGNPFIYSKLKSIQILKSLYMIMRHLILSLQRII